MSILLITLVFICLVVVVFSTESLQSCTSGQGTLLPCMCCKKQCFEVAAEMTEEYFGHMPGSGGHSEILFHNDIMKKCLVAECVDYCKQ